MCPRNAAKVLSSVVLLALAAPMSAADRPAVSGLVHVRLGGRYDAGTVQRSLDRASGRLEKPQCQRVFTDFQDASGRPSRTRSIAPAGRARSIWARCSSTTAAASPAAMGPDARLHLGR